MKHQMMSKAMSRWFFMVALLFPLIGNAQVGVDSKERVYFGNYAKFSGTDKLNLLRYGVLSSGYSGLYWQRGASVGWQ